MKNKGVRQSIHDRLSIDLDSVVTCSTLIVRYRFTSCQSSQAIKYTPLVLDFQCEIEEWLFVFADLTTAVANTDCTCFTSEDILKEVFLRSELDRKFQAVKHHVEEFLGVFLLPSVRWLVVEVLKCKAKFTWVIVLAFGKLKETHQLHKLMQHVVVQLLTLVHLKVVLNYFLSH